MLFTQVWNQHSTYSPSIIDYVQRLSEGQHDHIDSGIARGAKSAQGLIESKFDLFQQPHAALRELVGFIEKSLALAISIANDREAPPDELQIEFVDSWYHVTNEGGFHDAHVHHGCSWCGIYYLQIGSAGKRTGESAPNGGSRFYCPLNIGGGYRDFGNRYLASSIDPPIQDGLLLLFPSFLMHSGLPYAGSQNRVVIAFNAQCVRK